MSRSKSCYRVGSDCCSCSSLLLFVFSLVLGFHISLTLISFLFALHLVLLFELFFQVAPDCGSLVLLFRISLVSFVFRFRGFAKLNKFTKLKKPSLLLFGSRSKRCYCVVFLCCSLVLGFHISLGSFLFCLGGFVKLKKKKKNCIYTI